MKTALKPLLLLSILSWMAVSSSAYALSILLDGTRTVLSGNDCDIATYRFGTTASFAGTPIDLYLVVNSEDNDYSMGDCIYVDNGVLSVRLRDTDPGEDVAFMDVTLTLVQQGTLTPVNVDRITATGFDLDSNGAATGQFSTSTDDIYLSGPGASFLSGATNIQYSTGTFAGGHTVYMQGQSLALGNCSDSPTSPVPSCRASATWTGGSTNSVSSISARFQNDNAYGQYTGTANALRLLQLSLDDDHAEELLADTQDHGDAPASFGDATHDVVSLYTILGNGLASDNETTYQSSVGADGDDNDGAPNTPNYDDEDAVTVGGVDFNNYAMVAGDSATLTVTTFGDGFLTAWFDYNGDGDFNDAGEQIANDIAINSTTVQTTNIPITVPLTHPGGQTYARFRFSKLTGLGPSGPGGLGEVEDYVIVVDPMKPSFNMVKSSDSPTISAAGVITYTFEFTNTGNVDLTNLTITDPNIDAGSLTGCPIATLAPAGVASCTATRTVPLADIDNGTPLINTASPSAIDPAGDPAPEDDTTDNSTQTTITPTFSMTLAKPAPTHSDSDSSGDISEGDTLTYTITASNTGTASLTNLVVSDPLITPTTITCASVAPGNTCVLSGTYIVTAADVAAGSIDNSAEATSDQTPTASDDQSVPLPSPAHTIVKDPPTNTDEDGSGDISIGDTLTYTITATNTGTANLTNLVVSDLLLTPSSNSCALVLPSNTCVLTGTYAVSSADVAAGTIDNTASAESDQTDSSSDSESTPIPTPELTIDKPVPVNADEDGNGEISLGDTLTYTITATNTGTATLTSVVVTDALITPNSQTCPTLAPGNTCVLIGTYIVSAADVTTGAIKNQATATSDQTPDVDDTQSVPVRFPEHTLAKAITGSTDTDGSGDLSAGDVLNYSITATNTGSAVLTNLIVSDPLLTPNSNTCAIVPVVGGICVLNGTYTVTAADVAAGSINNTATASSDQTPPIDDSETINLPVPALEISKPAPTNADEDSSGDVSEFDTLTYTITATNTGAANLTNVTVSDSLITPSSTSCALLAPSATCVLTGTYSVTAADVSAGAIVNTASADSDQTDPVTDDETVSAPTPDLQIDKATPTNADEDGSADISVGDTLTYTITATNNGTSNLTNVVVSDAMLTPTSSSCAIVLPGDTCVLTGTYSVTAADVSAGTITNTATANSDQTPPITDTETVTPPTPSHTLDKAAPSNADEDGTGDISSGDTLTYTITATNNGTAILTNLVVSDSLITPSSNSCASVPPAGTCVLTGTYVVTNADVVAGAISNTASAVSDQTPSVDDTEVVVVPSPSHTLDKAAPTNADEDGSGDVSLGDTLSYTITATNSGAANLSNLVVSDPLITPSSITCPTVAPAANCVLTGTYVVTATDIAAGSIDNTATSSSDQTDDVTDDETVVVPTPAHTIDKTAPTNADEDSSGDLSVGDTLSYTITATNSGTAVLTNLVVSDPMLTPSSNTCTSVAPAAVCTLTGTYVVTATDVAAGSITNTASSESDQTDPLTDTETVSVPQPSHAIDKPAPNNADEDGSGDISAGDTLTYTVTATNTGSATLTNMIVSDALLTPSSITCATLAPSATCVLTGSYVVTTADVAAGVIDNTATSDSDQTDPLDDSQSVVPPQPGLAIVKPAPVNTDEDSSGDVSAGDTLTYTITATNTGTATLTNVMVSDTLITPGSNTCTSLAAGATCVLIGTYTVTSTDVVAGTIDNTASSNSDQTTSVSDDETVTIPMPDLALTKPAPVNGDQDGSGDVSVGDVLTYTITATNSGTAALTNVVVSDPLITPNSISCAVVAPASTCVLVGDYTVTAADITAGSIDNTATADSDQTPPVTDNESVPVPSPAHTIVKPAPTHIDADGSSDISAGDNLNYVITVTNTGTATLTNMVVSDPLLTPSSITCASLAPTATCVLNGSYIVSTADVIAGTIANIASSDSDQTDPLTDDETVTLPSPAHTLDKPAPDLVDNDASGDVSAGDVLNYTITATNSGTAILTNLVITDPLITPNSTTCVSVAPGNTCVLAGAYTVTTTDLAAGSIDNTASSESDQTATVTDDETVPVPTPVLLIDKPAPVNADNDGSTDVSAGDVLTYTITAINSGTATLTNVVVSDPLLTPNSITCASVPAVAGASCVLIGTYTVTAADVTAGAINNTASANSDQTDAVNDNETVPAPSPALVLDKSLPTNADNDSSGDISAGDVLTYTVTATNSGTAVLTNVIVTDPLLTPTSTSCASLAVGADCVLTGTYTVTAADVTAGVINNTASADSDQTDSVDDTETVNLLIPSLALDKPAPFNADEDNSGDVSAGDTLTYTITATNNGASSLTNVVVSDPLLTPNSNSCALVPSSGTCVLTGVYVVTPADVTAGVIDNTAGAGSDQTKPITDDESVPVPAPDLTLFKPAPAHTDLDASGDISVGDELTYTITATNTGTATLTNIVVSDPLITPNTTSCTTVLTGATCTLVGIYTVTAADVAAGSIDNTASADSDQTDPITDAESVPLPAPVHTLDKAVPVNADEDGSGDISVGDTLTYSITATNTGTAILTNLAVSDALITPSSATCATVNPAATCVLVGDYIVTPADVAAAVINNTATSSSNQTGPVDDTQTVSLSGPSHTIDKSAPTNADEDGSGDISVGDTLTYSITATNNGTANLTNLLVSDPLLTPNSINCALVTPGSTCVLTGTYSVTAADVTASVIDNTASADSDQTDPLTDDETVPVPPPELSLIKPAPTHTDHNGSGDISVGDELIYTITATNSGTATLTNVLVSDPMLTPNSQTCASLAPTSTCVLVGSYTVVASDVASGNIDNTASADSDQTTPVTDDETVVLPQTELTLDKATPANADNDGSTDISAGDVLTYTITATNTGTAALINVVVTDALITPTSNTCALLAPGNTCVLTGVYTVTPADVTAGVINNTADADSDQTDPVSDNESVVVPEPSHTLAKSVPTNTDNDTSGDISAGDTLTYTVTATNSGTAMLTNLTVSDPLLTPGSITCASVAVNATCVLIGTYTVTPADVAAGTIDNTASSVSDQTDPVDDAQSIILNQPSHVIDKALPVNADEDGSGDISVGDTLTYTVIASNNGAASLTNLVVSDPMLTPGSLTCPSVAPSATCVLVGTYSVTAADVTAGTIDNVASAESDQTDLTSDDVSVPVQTPAMTLDKLPPTNVDEDGSTDISVGDTLTYTVTATNNGAATLTNVVVSDPLISPNSVTCALVPATSTCVLIGTYVVTAADVSAGVINNTASATSDQLGPIDDSESVPVPQPGISIDKPAPNASDPDTSADLSAGDVLTYTVTATNTGTSVLTNLVVTDALLSPTSTTCLSVAPADSCVLIGTYTVTTADVNAGVINNTAGADADQVDPVDDSESVVLPTPAYTLSKAAPVNADEDGSGDIGLGDTLTYTITATNTGTATLTNLTVSDSQISPNTITCATVAPAASCVLTGTYSVTPADVAAGVINNTATSDADQTSPLDDSQSVVLTGPSHVLDKTAPTNADEDGSTDLSVGDTLTYVITATNNGSSNLTNLVVSDPMISPASNTCALVVPGDTCVLTGTYSVLAGDVASGSIDNTASSISDQTPVVNDDESVPVPTPLLGIDKITPTNADEDGNADLSVADTLTYSITATNLGTAVLTNVVVSDPMLSPSTQTCASMSPGAVCVLTGTYVVTAADVVTGSIVNTASADSDQTSPVTDTENTPMPEPAFALDKSAPANADEDGSGDVSVGDTLTYTITATNTGNANLTNLVVDDPLLTPNNITCASVATGDTCVLAGTYSVQATDVAAGSITNIANADSDQTDPLTDDELVPVPNPVHTLNKPAPALVDNDSSGDISVGDTLTYTITATNTGTANLTNMVVSDPLITPNTTSCALVTPNATCVLVGTYTVTATDLTNTVINNTASSDTDQTEPLIDEQMVNLPVPDLQIDKPAPSNADEDGSTDVSVGDTLTYVVTATNNGTANLTNVVVSDPMLTPGSITCALLAPNTTCVLTGAHSVTAANVQAGSIVNEATADSDQTPAVEDTQTVTPPTPSHTLEKGAPTNADEDTSGDVSVGDTLTYVVTATNNGTAMLTNLVVSDPMIMPNSISCPSVAPMQTCVLTGTYSVTPDDLIAGVINNTASSESDQTDPVNDSQTQNLTGPSLTLDKSLLSNADEDATTDFSIGDTLTYEITATNNGNANLTNVIVSDSMITPNSNSCAQLTPGATCMLTGTYQITAADVVTGSIDNTASADSDQTDSIEDTESVVLPAPLLDIDKAIPTNADEDGSGDITVGDTLSYTITATNIGTAVQTNVAINDSLLTPSSQNCPLVTPGAVCTLVGTYQVTAADVSAGSIVNTATAESDQSDPITDSITVNLAEPEMELAKAMSANADEDATTDISIGDTLTYTVTATNIGDISLTNVVVNDPMLTPATNTCALVAMGDTCVLSGTYVVDADDVAAGSINNTATADSDQTDSLTDSLVTDLPTPSLSLAKSLSNNADEDNSGDISTGDTLTYTVVATNNGSSTLTMVSVTDNMISPSNVVCASLTPLATCVLTGTYTVTAADVITGNINNTATATSDQTDPITDQVNVNLGAPALSLDKSQPTNNDLDQSGSITPGDILTYTVTASNTGAAVLTNVVVQDNMLTPFAKTCASLATGDTCVLVGTYAVTVDDAVNSSIVNKAVANSDQTGALSDTVTVPVETPSEPPVEPLPPVTEDDSETNQPLGQPVTVSVLDNDSDPENNIDPTTVVIIDPTTGDPVTSLVVPGEGTWVADPVTGDITFTPEPGFVDDPTPIVYTVTDTTGLVSNPSTVTIDYEEPAALTGTVWIDSDRDGQIDASEQVKAGWTLEVVDDQGNVVATAITDANGQYSVEGLIPGNYVMKFYNENGVFIAETATDGPLVSGGTQDLPLPIDPSGVVYDSTTREHVEGATLQLVNSAGIPVDPSCVAQNQQNQTTLPDGLYAFDVFPDAHPSCPDGDTYEIVLTTLPAGYVTGFSTSIPPQTNVFDSASNEANCTTDSHPTSGACEVQPQPDAPQGSDDTTYFTRFTLTSGDTNVIFNHIPIDPVPENPLASMILLKTVNRPTASTGDVLRYAIRVQNTAEFEASNVSVTDDLPRGFHFVEDSAVVTVFNANQNILSDSPVASVGIDPVIFLGLDLPASENGFIEINYAVRIGATVVQGEYTNTAVVSAGGSSNASSASVRVVADPVLEQATLVGKVFHDRDADGYQEDANATNITIKSDYFGWASHNAGGLPGRVSTLTDSTRDAIVLNMPLTDNNRFEVSTAEGTIITVDHDGTVTESHVGKRAKGITGQVLRISTRETEAVPTPTAHLQSDTTSVQPVMEITIENVGVHEEGIPGVRLATVEGWLIETDQAGRFHIPDVDAGSSTLGKQLIVKLDTYTLPDGAVLTTENPRVMRITNAALNTMRFGVKLPAQAPPAGSEPVQVRNARVEANLGSVFFDTDMHNIRDDQRGVVQDIIKRIKQFKQALILIEAHTDSRHTKDYNIALAKRRARTVEAELRRVLGDALMQNVSVEVDPLSQQELPHNDPRAIDYQGDVQ